ncbi:hypothetical protein ACFWUZ_12830 [Streptomyces sp. NPDC058646]|uniref:hypothetical protein n=1 Tax=Streptomyces sp. NPDC058646 TaxID=3346574 RepID=UPI0036697DAA
MRRRPGENAVCAADADDRSAAELLAAESEGFAELASCSRENGAVHRVASATRTSCTPEPGHGTSAWNCPGPRPDPGTPY